jgi:hypothetical protein
MAEYRHSKPSIRPLRAYQVVTYVGSIPARVSCKVKTAAHLRDEYGAEAAGQQQQCTDITRSMREQAVAQLRGANQPDVAARVAELVLDDSAPYATGHSYLKEYALSERLPDGRIRLHSPGLFQDYDRWYTALLPELAQGQSYCHLPTIEYMTALATGALQPGDIVTTEDDAPVMPAKSVARR